MERKIISLSFLKFDFALLLCKTLMFIKPFIQQRLILADGCNVDQNFFGHITTFISGVSCKGKWESPKKKSILVWIQNLILYILV